MKIRYYDRNEVSAMLRMSTKTLEREIKSGLIDSISIGKRIKFSEYHIQEYIKRNEIKNKY